MKKLQIIFLNYLIKLKLSMSSVIKTTILGCGSSGGVPRIDGDWGVCDPNNVKNIRSRCSILVERVTNDKKTVVLIDTSPDMRQQLLKAGVTNLDAVLYTHDHADQSGGIDDLRVFALRKRERVNVYLDKDTASRLIPRFNYCFKSGEKHGYPSILSENIIDPYKELIISGPGGEISFTPFLQHHGSIFSLGFKYNNIAYSSDVVDFPVKSLDYLSNLDYWIVDALRITPHPTHSHLDKTLQWVKDFNCKNALLTNMHIDLDYEQLSNELPSNIKPCYDGYSFSIDI